MTDSQFESVFRSHFAMLSNIAYSVIKDEDAAKDVVQQVFVKLWQKKDVLEIKGSIKSYLHRAVINSSLNYIEKNKRFFYVDSMKEECDISQDSQQKEISDAEIEQEIRKAINELPEKCNLVFSLSRFSGMSNKEIAEYLQISIKAVEKHIGKALKTLRLSLKPLYESLIYLILLSIFFNFQVGLNQLLMSY